MLLKRLHIALLNFLLAGLSSFASAQTDDLRELSIEELMNTEVISSTQQFVRLQEAPSTMFVVTGDQIRRWGIRRIAEVVDRLVPGAIAAEDIDDMILGFRGITADNNLKVLLLLNGHDYNTQWNNGPSSEVELGLMDDISKVEILIGPHSALYGSGALIAVINVINFIDGVDGLAAGVCVISATTLSIIALSLDRTSAAVLAACTAGGALGFLRHGFPPASSFMGDTGSNLLGYLLATPDAR